MESRHRYSVVQQHIREALQFCTAQDERESCSCGDSLSYEERSPDRALSDYMLRTFFFHIKIRGIQDNQIEEDLHYVSGIIPFFRLFRPSASAVFRAMLSDRSDRLFKVSESSIIDQPSVFAR